MPDICRACTTGRLVTTLRWRHRILWEKLGKPTLLMASADRFFRVQSFIFSRHSLTTGDKEITSSVIFLRLFVLVLVLSARGTRSDLNHQVVLAGHVLDALLEDDAVRIFVGEDHA